MRTAGIDLASQDQKTSTCVVIWENGAASVEAVRLGVGDADITDLVGVVDKAGIDVPLGWPISFVEALAVHSRWGGWPTQYRHAATEAFRYRRTDLHTWRIVGGAPPLSVSTDRIGIPAMRAAALISAIQPAVQLNGAGVVVEVYPAAALRIWGLESTKYKRPENAATREVLIGHFLRAASWLTVSQEQRELFRESDDALDALIGAMVARAAAVGLVNPIPSSEAEAARREGWIALPTADALGRMADSEHG